MRLPLLPPTAMTPTQTEMYREINDIAKGDLRGFKISRDSDGALAGPFNAYLQFPVFGRPFWDLSKALVVDGRLPPSVREVAILTVGTHFTARYEIYAHSAVGQQAGLTDATIATITSGNRPPPELSCEELAAYDVATALVNGKQVSGALYTHAEALFGKDGFGELLYLIASYCGVSVLLNGFDESVPGAEHGFDDSAPR